MDANKLQQTVDAIPKLRWYLFPKFQSDISKLPPTAPLKFKIFRSHFISMVLCRACWNFQELPSLENYGWEIRQNKIVAIMTDELPDPLALVEFSVCNGTTLCNSNLCKYQYNLPCIDMCKCISCQNEGERENYEFDKNNEYDSAEEDCQ